VTDDLPTLSDTPPGRYRRGKGGEYKVLMRLWSFLVGGPAVTNPP
jgi:hypothetical protein